MAIVNRGLVIPENIQVIIKEKEQKIEISGSKGKLELEIFPEVKVIQEGNKIFTKQIETNRSSVARKAYALAGTMNSLIYSGIKGVQEKHQKKLDIKGTGYKVLSKGKELEFTLGFSHSIKVAIPNNLEITCPNNTQIIIQGISKEEVGKFAAKIENLRRPNRYKMKGIYRENAIIKLKPGKTLNK